MSETGDVYVFDADDTLWMNEWQYSRAYAAFFSHLYEIMGDRMPNIHLVRDVFFKIDGHMFKDYGVRRGRVAESMVLTYRKVCEWIQERFGEELYSEAHEMHIRGIGDSPFDYSKLRFLPGVQETLSHLAGDGSQLCLLTSYDRSVFHSKADRMGLAQWFPQERTRVVEMKKSAEDFIQVSGYAKDEHRDAKTWYTVGNGESDIIPPLEIADNWRGIYIPFGSTSRYFKDDSFAHGFRHQAIDHPRVRTIREFREILY